MTTIAIIGGGVMGETFLAALTRQGGHQLSVAESRPSRAAELAKAYPDARVAAMHEIVQDAQVVLLVVKPQDLADAASQLAGQLRDDAVVVSLAAGVTVASIESALPPGTAVVRVMPNTPALVGAGMSAASRGEQVTDAQLELVLGLLQAAGDAIEVPEKYQDAVTAVSGSGPAYVFYLAEAMIEGGVHAGLPRDVATRLATQTIAGAGRLLVESDSHPSVLREQVTSPAGTTAAALRTLDEHGVRHAVIAAELAAQHRSRELAG